MTVLLATVVLACAGGKSRNITPAHLTAGMSEIKKGNGWYQRGCYSRSLEHYFRAHEMFSASDQVDGAAMSLNNIGTVYRTLGNYDSAAAFLDESYRMYGDLGDAEAMVRTLSNMAAVLLDKGDLDGAESTIGRAQGIASGIKMAYNPLRKSRGVLLAKRGDHAAAEKILLELKGLVDATDHFEMAAINSAIGSIMLETGRLQDAIGYYGAALAADRWAGFHRGIAGDLEKIGSVYDQLEDYPTAADYYQRSLKVYALIGYRAEAKAILDRLERIPDEAAFDLNITRLFVERWLRGEADGPCE